MLQKNFKGRVNDRRIRALARLQEMERTGHTLKERKPIDEDGQKRITREISNLESKIMEPAMARGIRTKKSREAKN